MTKRKKQTKIEISIAELQATLSTFARQLEQETSTRRIAEASVREVISAQTDRLGKLTQRLNETVGQTNAGFQVAQSNTNTAAKALSAHDGQIARLIQRVNMLEEAKLAAATKRVTRKVKR